MLKPQFILNLAAKLVVVLFAGAGGSCTGIEQALGRHVDIATNHSEPAVSSHRVNHPQTRHYREDVRALHPRDLCGNQPVGYLHLSPDCTHFSQAKGGQPRDVTIRSLPWVGIRWAGTVKPDVITVENVKEITKWGRLIAKRCKESGRVVKLDGTVAAVGEHVPRHEQFLVPDPKHAGKTWARYLRMYRSLGYVVEWRVLCSADYGVPTTRSRLFLIARRDGMSIVWPEPTHFKNPGRGQKRWVAAHTCIDFSLPSQSIFDREKPLVPATLRRVATGLKRYVLDNADPFIVPVTHSGGVRVHDSREPLRTVTTAKRGEFMLATPTLVQVSYGERQGQAPRALDIQARLGVTPAGGVKHAMVTAFVEQANGFGNCAVAHGADRPFSTIMTKGANQRLASACIVQAGHGDGSGATKRRSHGVNDIKGPVGTVTASGGGQSVGTFQLEQAGQGDEVDYRLSPEAEAGALRCAAFLIEYYSSGGQWSDLKNPTNTATTKARLALVTVWIKGDPYVVVDICLRMLTARELANSMSFPADYVLDRGHDGRIFSKSQQVHHIGNAVPPTLQRVVTAANYSDEPLPEMRAAA